MDVPIGVDQVVRRDVADEQADDRPAEDDQHRARARAVSRGAGMSPSVVGVAARRRRAPARRSSEWVVMSSSSSSTDEPGTGFTGVMAGAVREHDRAHQAVALVALGHARRERVRTVCTWSEVSVSRSRTSPCFMVTWPSSVMVSSSW